MITLSKTAAFTGPMWQLTITIFILAVAIVWVGIKAWRMFHSNSDSCDKPTCDGCPIKDACKKN